jgi:hypothetical protein
MKFLSLILVFFLARPCFGQFKIGIYRNECSDSLWHVDMKLYNDRTFNFNDMRDRNSCFMWGKYKGLWLVNKDTLVLYIDFDRQIGSKTQMILDSNYNKIFNENYLRKFLIGKKSISYAFPNEQNFFKNWGNFEWTSKN